MSNDRLGYVRSEINVKKNQLFSNGPTTMTAIGCFFFIFIVYNRF